MVRLRQQSKTIMMVRKIIGYLILLPIVTALFCEPIFKFLGLHLETSVFNNIRFSLFTVSIVSSFLVIFARFREPKKPWVYIVATISLIISSTLLYIFYSLSHFGF